jgi:hypothetical protein
MEYPFIAKSSCIAPIRRGDFARGISTEFLNEVREYGFPYMVFDDTYLRLFERLKNYDDGKTLNNGLINRSNQYLKLATVFFPKIYGTKVHGAWTALESFNNDKQLSLAIELASERGNDKVSLSKLRGTLSLINGTQVVYNFRPEVSKWLYNRYAPNGKVYDFSMGWGGRLVGFLASTAREYVGTDVNIANQLGYNRIKSTYVIDKDTAFYTTPAEDFKLPIYENYFDFSFSSPPYFNKEEYSADPNQSYLRYPKFDAWCEGFLRPMIFNNYYVVKSGGHFGINVADIKIGSKIHPILSFTKKYAEEVGFIQEDEFNFDTYRAHESNVKSAPEVLVVYKKV